MMLSLLGFLNPLFGFLRGTAGVSMKTVGGFFGSSSAGGRKMILVLILLGLMVLVPQLRVKLAQKEAAALAVKADQLKYDVARAELSAVSAEQQRDAEATARVEEREQARNAMMQSELYLKQQAAREATVTNRLKEIANALNARKAGDAVAGDSAVILRNLNKVGIESVSGAGDRREAPPASPDPVPSVVGPVADVAREEGAVAGSIGPSADGGVRSVASASGPQQ